MDAKAFLNISVYPIRVFTIDEHKKRDRRISDGLFRMSI